MAKGEAMDVRLLSDLSSFMMGRESKVRKAKTMLKWWVCPKSLVKEVGPCMLFVQIVPRSLRDDVM